MSTTLKIDKLGRIVLPKAVRNRLQLSPGDELELECTENQMTLRPVKHVPPLSKKDGVWVFRSGEPLTESTVRETTERVRRER